MNSITYTIPLPLKSQALKPKSQALMTMNVMRSSHPRSVANFKLRYSARIRKIILDQPLPKFAAIHVEYVLNTAPTKGKPIKSDPLRGSKPRNLDLLNLGAVVSKSFLDCLTELHIIPDDTIEYVHKETFISSPWATEENLTITLTEVEPLTDPRRTT